MALDPADLFVAMQNQLLAALRAEEAHWRKWEATWVRNILFSWVLTWAIIALLWRELHETGGLGRWDIVLNSVSLTVDVFVLWASVRSYWTAHIAVRDHQRGIAEVIAARDRIAVVLRGDQPSV